MCKRHRQCKGFPSIGGCLGRRCTGTAQKSKDMELKKKVQTKWWAFGNAPDQVQIRVHSKPYLSRSVFQTCTFLHLASVPQGEERQLSSSSSLTFSSLSLSSLVECWMRMFRNRIKCILILLIYCSAFARKYQASALGDSSPSFCHQIFWRGKSELILCRMVGRW